MRITGDTMLSELSCSRDESLMHHKYVKREKVKGKWRYWYEGESSDDLDLADVFKGTDNKLKAERFESYIGNLGSSITQESLAAAYWFIEKLLGR